MKNNKLGATPITNPLLARSLSPWRPRLVLLSLTLGFLALGGRALYLQGVNDDFLKAEARSRYARTLDVPATRGRITDRSGDILAVSTPVQSIWAIPGDARTATPAQLRQLAQLMEMDANELNKRLSTPGNFVYLKRQLPPAVAERIAELKIPGIHQQTEYRRYYPGGVMMSHLLGFTGIEDKGQEGIELAFEKRLAGKSGSHQVVRDRRGRIVEDVTTLVPAQDGAEVQLSVDSKLQYLAYSALRDAVEANKAKSGSAVILDARTGEVLALVNEPSYNPNNKETLSGSNLRNRAVTDAFEPGSVMKPFIAALALESGRYQANTKVDTGRGAMVIGNARITDTHANGVITVAEIIQRSSNIGAVTMALSFTPNQMWTYFDSLGFGHVPGLGFPGETTGLLRPARSWRPIEQATMSYGHGISVSLMHMATAYLAFARDGDIPKVSLTKVDEPVAQGKRVFSSETARQVRVMLEMVTQKGGTATKAQVPGYRVGGKTGTAHKLAEGRYVNKYVASFVGIAPISDPRIVVAVMIDEPTAGKHYGGEVAGPLFSRIAGGTLKTLGVAPDAPLVPLQLARRDASSSSAEDM